MCSRAGSSTVWMDETVILDVLGSLSTDLMLRGRHRRIVSGDRMGKRKEEDRGSN